MPKRHVNPPSLFSSVAAGFSQAVSTSGSRTVYISGQTAWNSQRRVVGANNLEEQTQQALRNLRTAVEEAQGTMRDVVSIRVYVVDYDSKSGEIISKVLRSHFDPQNPPAATWVGVQSLAVPEFLIEIEAVAVIE